jgi:NarL family two-component system response regulator YdfI
MNVRGVDPVIRLLIVDDHTVVRQGLSLLFGTVDDIEVVGTAADGVVALSQIDALTPDVVLMDIGMPRLDGIEATRRIVTADPDARVVILTGDTDQAKIQQAVEAGALGCLLKDADPEALFAAVRSAYLRETAS